MLLGFSLLLAALAIAWLLARQRSLAQKLHESERRFREQEQALRLLGEAGQALAASLEYEKTLRSVARLAVEHIADWCLVDVLEDGTIRHTAIGHADPDKEEFAREYLRRYPPDPNATVGVANVLRTGEPELVPEIPDSGLRAFAQDEEHLRTLRQLGMHSAMTVPMTSRGRTLGAITLVAADSEGSASKQGRRAYGPEELVLAQELAARAALAVDNARLFAEAERRAREETALRQAAEAVGASFTEDEVIRQIARSAVEATGADAAFVKRIDIERGQVEVVSAAGENTPPRGDRRPYTGSFTERVVEREEPEIIEKIAEARQPIAARLMEVCPACSAVVLPLVNAGEPIGSLVLLRAPGRDGFQSDEVARARTFANLAALAFRRVHLLEESERRRQELEQVTESRARLMRGFSHDVKNPLGAADGYAQLLEEGVVDRLTEKQKQSIGQVRRSIHSALRLIKDLLELARTEAGQIEIRHATTDVRQAVREMTEEYRAQAESKGLAMDVHLPQEFGVIDSDADRVRQILGNLVSNAVKYTDEGGIIVRVGIREDGDAPGPGEWIFVDVSDTGAGIPEEKQHLLFQEFVRLKPDTERGAGIGLAISRRVARALHGDITVDSRAGRGSTFTLWLPCGRPGSGSQRLPHAAD